MPTKKTKSRSALDTIRKELDALVAVNPPQIPVDRLLGEANALAKLVEKHAADLRRVGVEPALLKGFRTRVEALADAHAQYILGRTKLRSKKEVALEREGIELRSDMIADGRYALRADADAQASLDAISDGEGLDDSVQDLRALSGFHQTHAAALARVGVKAKAKAERATVLARTLGDTLATRRTETRDTSEAKDLRDRAATHLGEAMRDIRAAGVYAFRKQPDLVSRFRSAYLGDVRTRRSKAKPAPAPQPSPAPPS